MREKIIATRGLATRYGAQRLLWVTGGKTPSEYMLSELPQLADIVRRVRRYSASPLVLRITAFWVRAIPR